MKLKKVNMANYRGFDQLELSFEPDITIIAGVNGVGKTGILRGVASALSYAMPRFTISEEKPLPFSELDIQWGKASMSLALEAEVSDGYLYVDIIRRKPADEKEIRRLNSRRDELRFAYRETERGSQEVIDIEDELRRIELLLKKPEDEVSVRGLATAREGDSEQFLSGLKKESLQDNAVLYPTNRLLSRLPPALGAVKEVKRAIAFTKALDQLEVSLYDFAGWYRFVLEVLCKKDQEECKIIEQLAGC